MPGVPHRTPDLRESKMFIQSPRCPHAFDRLEVHSPVTGLYGFVHA